MNELLKWLLDYVIAPEVFEVSSMGIKRVVLRRPFEKLWFIDKHKYWDGDHELDMRAHSRSILSLLFYGWHNLEVKAIYYWPRSTFYASVPN